MTNNNFDHLAGEAAKAAPPLLVSTATFFGFTLQEWVYIATIIYTVIQIGFLLYDRFWRKDDIPTIQTHNNRSPARLGGFMLTKLLNCCL